MKAYKTYLAAILVGCAAGAFSVTGGDIQTDVALLAWKPDRVEGYISFYNLDNGIRVSFPVRPTPPMASEAAVVADTNGDGVAFTGDYVASGIQSVKLTLTGDGTLPQFAQVSFMAASGRIWNNPEVGCYDTAGMPATTTLDFDLSAGWFTPVSGDVEAMWAEDIRAVTTIGVSIGQYGFAAQSYDITDFMLLGSDGEDLSGPAKLSPLEEDLQKAFGVTDISEVSEADKATEKYSKVLAGTDWEDPNDRFDVKVVTVEDGAVTVQWRCAPGRLYTLYRADDLITGFVPLVYDLEPSAADIEARYMTYRDDTASGSGPYFYRVKLQIPETVK